MFGYLKNRFKDNNCFRIYGTENKVSTKKTQFDICYLSIGLFLLRQRLAAADH